MRICSHHTFLHSSLARFLVLRTVSFCSRSFKASHILISGDGLVTLSGLSHLHSLLKHGQRHRAVFDFPQFSTSVQPWLSPELLRQVSCGYCCCVCVSQMSLSLTKGQLCPWFFWWMAATRPFSSHTCVRNFKLWKHLSGGSWFCALGALFHCSPSFIKRTPGYLSAVRTKALYCAYRIYMDIMWSQIFTVLGSQPVNWPAGRYLSRTCIGLR
jgi:hypothetical protein